LQAPDEPSTPWAALGGTTGFRLNSSAHTQVRLQAGDRVLNAALLDADLNSDGVLAIDDDQIVVFDAGDAHAFTWPKADAAQTSAASDGALISPMPGRIVSVSAEAGARVSKGQPIVTLEAMKMEHALNAPFDGKLVELTVKVGDQVSEGVTLARIEGEA
jgi:acetyl/propionyl-CoA carboxylase alpha subunit